MKFLIPLFLFSTSLLVGQSSYEVDVNRDTIYLGNTVTVSIKMKNMEAEPSSLDLSFPIVSGPNTSISTMFVNGESSLERSSSYTFMPEVPGVFEVPSTTISANDSTYISDPIVLVVLDNPNGIVQEDRTQQFGFGSFFNQGDLFGRTPPKAKKPKKAKRKMKRI